MEFTHGVDGATFRYQVIVLPTLNKVQIWYKDPWSNTWEVGHSKEIPAGKTAKYAAVTMKHFITGVIGHAEYNQLLPY